LDIVLGVSMAPASIEMVLVEGQNADGVTVEEDHIEVTAPDDPVTSASDRVIAAILGTREGAIDAGLRLSSIGVTWTDQLEAQAVRDALAAHKIENVMLVSAFLSAAALTQSVGVAMGYESTAVLFVEPESASLAVVTTADGSIAGVRKQRLDWTSGQTATAELVNMVVGLEKLASAVGGVFVIGSGVDVGALKPHLEAATALDVSAPEDPETALARGAALASANAPLFVSSTAALAYSLDPGTGAVDPSVLPDHLRFLDASAGDDGRAYSAVPDDDVDAPTVLLEAFAEPRRRFAHRPLVLLGSGIAVLAIGAVVALEIATAVSIRRDSVAVEPSPAQQLIVPTQQAPPPAPAEVPAAQPKVELPAPAPAPAAVPKPQAPVIAPAAPVPAVAAPAPVPVAPIPAPAAPAPPVVLPIPVPIRAGPPLLPLVVPPRLAPVPAPQSPLRPGTNGPGGWPGIPGGGGPIQAPAPVPRGPFGGGGFPGIPGGGAPIQAPAPVPSGPFGGGGFPGGGFPRGPVAGPAPAPIPRGPFGGGGFPGGGFPRGPFGGGGFGGGGHGGGGGGGGHR
jgi:hypothetical protein